MYSRLSCNYQAIYNINTDLLTFCSFFCRFIIGFFLATVPWYVGAIILLCTRNRMDPREKPGFYACTVGVSNSYFLSFRFLEQCTPLFMFYPPPNFFCLSNTYLVASLVVLFSSSVPFFLFFYNTTLSAGYSCNNCYCTWCNEGR